MNASQIEAASFAEHNQPQGARTCGDAAGTTAKGAPLSLRQVERRHIAAVLQRTDWHQGKAASLLGISAKTLYRKIREYGFERPARGSRVLALEAAQAVGC